ncbi:unnamed protein product [Microthlaspi erraticum]|uniref:RNase H type-1 domain-containing protein n=1 Tax=Microthlaspi erraticum TaxID=1685480 RepID=A0A6D2K1M4_9BRAS|nr:unnamed protein product [Microthlaspi erraticum]
MGPATRETVNWVVADLLQADTDKWNREKVESFFPEIKQQILCIKPSLTGVPDKQIWISTKSGIYTTKTGYHVAYENKAQAETQQGTIWNIDWNAEIWSRNIPPKIQMFLWRVAHGALEIGSIWDLTPTKNPIILSPTQTFPEVLKTSKLWLPLPPTGIEPGSLFPWISWCVWGARNHLLFENRSFKPTEIITKACADAREWQEAQKANTVMTTGKPRVVPPHTDPEATVLYTDAAWNQDNKSEALAIREALHQAKISGWNSIHLRSDSQPLIRAMQSGEQITEIFGILRDIFGLSKVFVAISFNFVPRSDNSIADALAKKFLQDFTSLYRDSWV